MGLADPVLHRRVVNARFAGETREDGDGVRHHVQFPNRNAERGGDREHLGSHMRGPRVIPSERGLVAIAERVELRVEEVVPVPPGPGLLHLRLHLVAHARQISQFMVAGLVDAVGLLLRLLQVDRLLDEVAEVGLVGEPIPQRLAYHIQPVPVDDGVGRERSRDALAAAQAVVHSDQVLERGLLCSGLRVPTAERRRNALQVRKAPEVSLQAA
mmetsp:Transcript_16488/g.43567  ORF Transcript_16488/g.43567 Transcript_16488/m.43567 type:complete len:213 (-) Transcript_16488:76-714(-)